MSDSLCSYSETQVPSLLWLHHLLARHQSLLLDPLHSAAIGGEARVESLCGPGWKWDSSCLSVLALERMRVQTDLTSGETGNVA